MKSLGLLVLRLTVGTLLAGHGAQKLFGWFEGPGWRNTATWAEGMNMRPGEVWGTLAGAGEFGGGTLMALGLLDPIGPVAAIGAMSMATAKAHWGKPIWAAKGGAELAVSYGAAAATILLAGPGKLSLDELLGIRLPRWLAIPGLAVVAGTVYAGVTGELPLPKEWQARLQQQFQNWQQQAQVALAPARQAITEATTPAAQATTTPAAKTSSTTRASTTKPAATPTTPTTSTTDRLEEEQPEVSGTL